MATKTHAREARWIVRYPPSERDGHRRPAWGFRARRPLPRRAVILVQVLVPLLIIGCAAPASSLQPPVGTAGSNRSAQAEPSPSPASGCDPQRSYLGVYAATQNPTPVHGVAYAPDGRTLARAGGTGVERQVTMWEIPSGQEVRTYQYNGVTTDLAIAPDGQTLAVKVGGGGVTLRSLSSGEQTDSFGFLLDSLAFAPDGQSLATTGSGGVTLLELPTLRRLYFFSKRRGDAAAVAFAPDSLSLAMVGDGGIELRELATGQVLRAFGEPGDRPRSLAFAPDGHLLASGQADGVHLWEIATGQELRSFGGAQSHVVGLAFAPDGRILAAGQADGAVHLWDVATGQELRTLRGCLVANYVSRVAFAPDGQTLAAGYQNHVALWESASGRLLRALVPAGAPRGVPTPPATRPPGGR